MAAPNTDTERRDHDGRDARERALVRALRRGDENAFAELVNLHHTAMVRLARAFVGDRSVAEEVAQDAWLAALGAVDQFEGRSSVKTWLFRIVTNIALKRAQRERRTVPFSAWGAPGPSASAVDPERFLPADHPDYPGHWSRPPTAWDTGPEGRLIARETTTLIARAIDALPDTQRAVISLRDVEGWSSEEVCETLGVTEGNQRVLLHRARSSVRGALEGYLREGALA